MERLAKARAINCHRVVQTIKSSRNTGLPGPPECGHAGPHHVFRMRGCGDHFRSMTIRAKVPSRAGGRGWWGRAELLRYHEDALRGGIEGLRISAQEVRRTCKLLLIRAPPMVKRGERSKS